MDVSKLWGDIVATEGKPPPIGAKMVKSMSGSASEIRNDLATEATAGNGDQQLNASATVRDSGKWVGSKTVGAVAVVAAKKDAASLPAVMDLEDDGALAVEREPFPGNLATLLGVILAQSGKAYAVLRGKCNPQAVAVGSRRLNNHVRKLGRAEGYEFRRADIRDINESLRAHAEMTGVSKLVWLRVAPIKGGVEIDSGDDSQTRYRLTGGKFEVIESGSETLFFRTPSCLPMVQPAEVGNIKLLKQYVNLDAVAFKLFVAWLSYTMALPKQASSKYVFLTPRGGEGSGKSEVSRVAAQLIDPRVMALQILPNNAKDLAIATQNAHLLCFDNVRFIAPAMADVLCVAATGGALASRQLYSDDEQHIVFVHGAMLLNGIHAFASEPDFAQRCLPLYLEPIKKDQRKTEAEMKLGLQADLPAIQRGLFDLIAQVFLHLPSAKVTSPERMLDFCKWLAAMEAADGAHPGVYQDAYSAALQEGQRDTLQACVLAAAVLDYAETHVDGHWSGTPTELLSALNSHATQGTQRSREWPMNPIALSKRLLPLQASLLTQGVSLELSRGKHRTVTIKKTASAGHA